MNTPFISSYYNLFINKECSFLSFIYCYDELKDEFTRNKLINKIKYIDYFIVYTKYEFDELIKYKDVFSALMSLNKIFYLSSYDNDFNEFSSIYNNHITFGIKIRLSNNKLLHLWRFIMPTIFVKTKILNQRLRQTLFASMINHA